MSRSLFRAAATALAVVTAVALAPGSAGAVPPDVAAATAPQAGNAWTEVVHPRASGQNTYLYDVVAVGPDDIWAVGYRWYTVGGALEFRTYGQHCVGGVCTQANLRDREGAPATNFLYGIAAGGPNQIWAVGYSRNPGQASIGLAERYDGTSWQIVATPEPPTSTSSYLSSVAVGPGGTALAVGNWQAPSFGGNRPLAMTWDGASWTLLTVPAVKGCTDVTDFRDVVTVGRVSYVVGVCRTAANVDGGFVVSYSAASGWRTELDPTDPVLPTTPTALDSIAYVPGSGLWAVGSTLRTSNPPANSGLTVRSHLGGWSAVATPLVGDSTTLESVAGIAPNAVMTVGITATSAFAERLSLYWAGRRYVPVPAGDYSILWGVAYDPAGQWWAVGHDLGVSVIQRIAAR